MDAVRVLHCDLGYQVTRPSTARSLPPSPSSSCRAA